MSSSARRCEPRFPTAGVLLDNSALVRLWKCGALAELAGTVRLHVAGQVAKEFQAQGPSERAALADLGATTHSVRLGTPAWGALCRLRGGRCSTRDLGEEYVGSIESVRGARQARLIERVESWRAKPGAETPR